MEAEQNVVRLSPPGAGLPGWERRLLSVVFWLYCRLTSKQAALRRFASQAEGLLQAVAVIEPAVGIRRVLIDRPAGIEDSSRHWSLYMVLEHLVIVNGGIVHIVRALCRGSDKLADVRIENVKPHEEAGPEQVEAFRRSVELYVKAVSSLDDLHTPLRHPHPWFGPMSAHQWHCLAAVHMSLHRRQAERILKRMVKES